MKYWLMFLALNSFSLFAAEPTIVGVWELTDWQVFPKEGKQGEFCKGAHGLLIYEESGYVSTAINCPNKKDTVKEPADFYNRVFYYAGTYKTDGDQITKQVTNSTYLPLIGKPVLRNIVKLTEDEMILTGTFGPNRDELKVSWKRK